MVGIKEKFKLQIVEHHNEVLPIVIRDIGVHLKSGEDVALVRFDSFANLLVPKDVQADEIETLDNLLDSINNECWILSAVYRGYITKIFWFKPPWAHQFQDGKYQIQVGKCHETGLLKVTSTNPYFTSNCVYSSSDKLSNIRTVDVYVSTGGLAKNYATTIEKPHPPIYDNDSGSESLDGKKTSSSMKDSNHKDNPLVKRVYALDATLIDELLENRSFFIDINLSFFSTDDAIRKQLDENEYEILRYVYTRVVQDQSEPEIQRYIAARENILEQIRASMEEYITGPKADQQIFINDPYLAALMMIIRYKKLDWKVIHNYGMHLSDTRPPLHVSSEEMVIYLNESMSKILQSIRKDPMLITISRCVDEGYCSTQHADLIQQYVEKKIGQLYKIEETIGKSLLIMSGDDDDDDEEDNPKDRKAMIISDDDNSPLSTNDNVNMMNAKSDDQNASISPAIPSNNRISPSNSKGDLSPGEVTKAISPSSLSEGSPILD